MSDRNIPTNLVVSIQDGMFVCTDGAGSFTRPATDDEKLFWAEIVRLRLEHEQDLERMERAADELERLQQAEGDLFDKARWLSCEIERLKKIEAIARKFSGDMATSMDWRELRELLA